MQGMPSRQRDLFPLANMPSCWQLRINGFVIADEENFSIGQALYPYTALANHQ